MGALRWTGTAFKLLGELLTAAEFEQWVEAEGKALLKSQMEKLVLKGFAGRARARRALRRDIQDALDRSETLREGLAQSLASLPGLLSSAGRFMKLKKAVQFHAQGNGFDYVVAVPRVLVRNDLRSVAISDLGASAELSRFTGLPHIFLTSKADAAESVFFDSVRKDPPVPIDNDKALVIGADSDFDWHIGQPPGHYYLGYPYITSRLDKKGVRTLHKEFAPALATLKAQLASVSVDELDEFVQSFNSNAQ